MHDLVELGIWNENMKQRLIQADGSIQNIPEIPQHIKDIYKTVWEIKQRAIIDMAADRGAFICQSQSMNIHMEDANYAKLTSMHFYAWRKGLKTGLYYLRTRAASSATKFTIDMETVLQNNANEAKQRQINSQVHVAQEMMAHVGEISALDIAEGKTCSIDDPDCLACSA
jgi:ribonucleoside-diphosphate reductase alpha chain